MESLTPVKNWLRSNICMCGARFEALELVRRVTRDDLSAKAYKSEMVAKYAAPQLPQVASTMSCNL